MTTVDHTSQEEDTMQSNQPQYLTEKSVSNMTGIALSTLRNMRFEGRGISYCKIGRSVRYKLQDVINYMESHRIQTFDLN